MQFQTIRYETDGRVGIIRLHRPERMNAVIEQMYKELQSAFELAGDDDTIRAVVLTGTVWKRESGDKQAFCAGADLKAHAEGTRTAWQRREYIHLAHQTTYLLHEFPKPVIAAVNGPARGAGAEMALNCDFVLMADEATLAFTETGLGTFVGGGVTRHLERMVGVVQARHLIYSGRVVDGKEAVRLGLALESQPVDRLLPRAIDFANELAQKAPISLAFAKELINRAHRRDLYTVLMAEAEAILACMNTEDWREGIVSFAEKRQPVFKGK
jgi:enoyl-CoA hydratase